MPACLSKDYRTFWRSALSIILCFIAIGCSGGGGGLQRPPWQEIMGRDEGDPSQRVAIYRVRVPLSWRRVDVTSSVVDSTHSICDFYIDGDEGQIRIALHNFPSDQMDQRIPPLSQVARWKRQFDQLDPSSTQLSPQAYSGFAGYTFQGRGLIQGEAVAVLAWAMQLAPEHYRELLDPAADEVLLFRQMRADVTIKATGPQSAMDRCHSDIVAFARSLELIHEIPVRP